MKNHLLAIFFVTLLLNVSCKKNELHQEADNSSLQSTKLSTNSGTTVAIVVDPNRRFQTMKGFGVSLAFWANAMGKQPDHFIDTICNDLTSPAELNLNYFRFNVGAGDNPAHNHQTGDARMPGYKPSATGAYDYTSDSAQIKILKKIYALKPAAIYEAFCNSAPYWMTNSLCTSGATNGLDNLPSTRYADYADYLTTVVKHFKDVEGINFTRVEPFNEPQWHWTALDFSQQCHYEPASQVGVINAVYQKLSDKGMSYAKIVADDAGSIGKGDTILSTYVSSGVISKVSCLNVHSYYGNNTDRVNVYQHAAAQGREVWQTETDPLSITGSFDDQNLGMVLRLQSDLRYIQCPVWTDWQALYTYSTPWCYWTFTGGTLTRTQNYYLRKQFTHFIQPGSTIVFSNDSTTAALNSANNQLVLVVTNSDSAVKNYDISLNLFATAGTANVYRTSTISGTGTEKFATLAPVTPTNGQISYSAPAKSVTTFVIPVTLAPNGNFANATYKIQLKSSGLYLSVAAFGTADGTPVEHWDWEDKANEKIVLHSTGIGGYQIYPSYLTNGKVIQVNGQLLTDNATVSIYSDIGRPHERWSIISLGGGYSGYFKIVNRNSGKVLAVTAVPGTNNGDHVLQTTWQNTDNMKWLLTQL